MPPAAPAIQGKRIPLCAQPCIPHPPPAPAWDRQPSASSVPQSTRWQRPEDTEMGIRHSWVLSLLMLSQVGFGFLYLLFSTRC